MNGQRVIAVALLVASLFVLGTLSASLDATVTSTPDDAIDVDTDSLPFSGDGASEIADSYRQSEDGEHAADAAPANEGQGSSQSSGSDGESTSDAASEGAQSGGSGGSDGDEASGGSGQSQGQAGAGQDDSGQGQGSGSGSTWGLFAQYAILILAILALLGLLLIARVLARRREELVARLRALADRLGLLPTDDPATDVAVPDGEGEAATVVERAWSEMVRASGARTRPSDTPAECARAVIETGADPEPVEELTATYQRVRYGDGSITATDASRALERAREITPGDGPSIAGGSTGDPSGRGTSPSREGKGTVSGDGGREVSRE